VRHVPYALLHILETRCLTHMQTAVQKAECTNVCFTYACDFYIFFLFCLRYYLLLVKFSYLLFYAEMNHICSILVSETNMAPGGLSLGFAQMSTRCEKLK